MKRIVLFLGLVALVGCHKPADLTPVVYSIKNSSISVPVEVTAGQSLRISGNFEVVSEVKKVPFVYVKIVRSMPDGTRIIAATSNFENVTSTQGKTSYEGVLEAPKQSGEYVVEALLFSTPVGSGKLVVR